MGVFLFPPVELEKKSMSINQMSEKIRWQTNPTSEEVLSVYSNPHGVENLNKVLSVFVSEPSGRGVDETSILYSKEQENIDNELFFQVAIIVITCLKFSDEKYTRIVLPRIFAILERTNIYRLLAVRENELGGKKIVSHIKKVPELLDTSECTLHETFTLRMAAIFHDFGKMFDIGSDQLHFHALIASDIFKRFMEKYESVLLMHWQQLEAARGNKADQKVIIQEYRKSVNQAIEVIRLHHVLEQIDKKRLTPEVVAEIFSQNEVNPFILGLFVVADGGSVIPDNETYSQFLINNLNALSQVMDVLKQTGHIADETESMQTKIYFVQALQHLITEICDSAGELAERIKQVIREVAEKIDTFLATSLLGMQIQSSIPETI